MTQDEIIRMAREAGAEATHYETWGDVYELDMELLERFAALVAAHEREKQAEQEPVVWKDMAFARLGVVRDKMRPEDVATVQRFLDGDYAAPVRTKDLTDDEIADIFSKYASDLYKARAVIAADRGKNNANNHT